MESKIRQLPLCAWLRAYTGERSLYHYAYACACACAYGPHVVVKTKL